eukprot:g28316.t1
MVAAVLLIASSSDPSSVMVEDLGGTVLGLTAAGLLVFCSGGVVYLSTVEWRDKRRRAAEEALAAQQASFSSSSSKKKKKNSPSWMEV